MILSTALALHLLAASPADESLTPDTPPAETWYGWQTLIVDGAAALLVGTGTIFRLTTTTGAPGNGFIGVGVGLYFVQAPTVHGVHGNGWGLLGSVGVRFAALAIGAGVGNLVSLFTHGFFTGTTSYVEPAVGAAVGALLASSIDARFFAWQPTPRSSTASLPRWAPFAGSVRGAPVAGVAGVF